MSDVQPSTWKRIIRDGNGGLIRPLHSQDVVCARRFIEDPSPTSGRFHFLSAMTTSSDVQHKRDPSDSRQIVRSLDLNTPTVSLMTRGEAKSFRGSVLSDEYHGADVDVIARSRNGAPASRSKLPGARKGKLLLGCHGEEGLQPSPAARTSVQCLNLFSGGPPR